MADDLGGHGLHHLDGVGAHAVAVVEVGGHAHDHDVVLLLGPVHVGALVGEGPGDGLHLGGIAREDRDLAAPGVEYRVAAEELLAHLLFHEHALLVELVAHQGGGGDGDEVRAAHDARHVVGADGAPVGDAGGAVLVAARVAAVGVALGVADEDRDVGVIDVLVHDHVVALRREAQVDEVVVVLGVVARDLAGALELVVEVVAQDELGLGGGGAGVQAVGEEQQHVVVGDAAREELVEARADGDLAVRGGLRAALHDVGDDDDDLGAGVREVGERFHADGVADALDRGVVEAVPVLRQALRVLDGLSGDEDVGGVGKLGAHGARAPLKVKMHEVSFLLG